MTTFYPLEFVAHEIVGNDFEVINITPVGVEPHDLELSTSTTSELLDAKLVIEMGKGFQPAIEKTANSRDGNTVEILKSINEESGDPHVWLDPIKMKSIVELVRDEITKINPTGKKKYEKNADRLIADLSALHENYKKSLSNCELSTFVTSHDAFSQLAKRYNLKQISIAGISPENEPSPSRLNEISKIVKDEKISVIFTEELVSRKVAKTLSDQLGVKTEILSPLEGLSKQQVENKQNYFTLMELNLSQLSKALKCSANV